MVPPLSEEPTESRRPVRLLLVNPSPVRGGAEEMLLSFVNACDPARVRPVVACLADGPFVDDLAAAGAWVVRVRAGRLRYPWAWARAVARLRRLARDADAVLSWQVKGHYYGTPAARCAGVPAAWWDHGIRPARGEPRFVIDNLLPRALRARVVVTSSAAAAARHPRARVVHPGIDLEPYARADARADARTVLGADGVAPMIGIVGRLQPWKGQEHLLRAAPAILQRHPRARFAVIGGTPGGFDAGEPARLRALAAELGVSERVGFLGQRDDVAELLAGLDVFVHASRAEPFGIVIVEAMAAGVPVVADPGGGVPEIVEHGVSGLLASGPDAIAEAVARYLDDPAEAARIAAVARERARERFAVARFVRDVEDLVAGLAEGEQ